MWLMKLNHRNQMQFMQCEAGELFCTEHFILCSSDQRRPTRHSQSKDFPPSPVNVQSLWAIIMLPTTAGCLHAPLPLFCTKLLS